MLLLHHKNCMVNEHYHPGMGVLLAKEGKESLKKKMQSTISKVWKAVIYYIFVVGFSKIKNEIHFHGNSGVAILQTREI